MLAAAMLAARQILSPPFRTVLWKSIGLTVAFLAVVWVGLQALLAAFIVLPFPWLETAISVLSGLGLLFGLAFVVAPVTALFAGLFVDEVAALVEAEIDPAGRPGDALPLLAGAWVSLRFFGVVVLVNLIALPMVLFLGFGVLIFFIANAYLLGREYFQIAAMRYHDAATVRSLRIRHGARLFLAGMIIAGFTALPIVNLLAPLFATAFMVRVHKRIEGGERQPGGLLAAA